MVEVLRAIGGPEDIALADQVARFVQAMAPARTRREQLVEEVRAMKSLTLPGRDDREQVR